MSVDPKTVRMNFIRARRGERPVIVTARKSEQQSFSPSPVWQPGSRWRPYTFTVKLGDTAGSAEVEVPAGGQYRMVVVGCGPVPARLRRKRAVAEAVVLGANYALRRWGITCDGEAVLPLRTRRVRLTLFNPSRTLEVTVERRPEGSRKKYAPRRWIAHRTARPTKGKRTHPRPAI
jgi:hypothetical protein